MATPFDKAASSIPVTIVTTPEGLSFVEPGAARLRLDPPLHDHAAGAECVACAARGDVRAMLFDLLTAARVEGGPLPAAVTVDATALADARPVIRRLEVGAEPALGLRDHTVLRSFHLARVI